MGCAATAPQRLTEGFGFGSGMIIACMKPRSRDRSPHSVADDFFHGQLKEWILSRGTRFGQRPHPTMSKAEIGSRYDRFRREFYSWPSIARRFWANRSHPLVYLSMNLSLWRLYQSKPQRAPRRLPLKLYSIFSAILPNCPPSFIRRCAAEASANGKTWSITGCSSASL
jgi:hypothetical protein